MEPSNGILSDAIFLITCLASSNFMLVDESRRSVKCKYSGADCFCTLAGNCDDPLAVFSWKVSLKLLRVRGKARHIKIKG